MRASDAHRLKRRHAMCHTHFLALFHCHPLRASGSAGSWSCGGHRGRGRGAGRTGGFERGDGSRRQPTQRHWPQTSASGTSSSSRERQPHQRQRLGHEGVEARHPAAELLGGVEQLRDGHVGGGPAAGGLGGAGGGRGGRRVVGRGGQAAQQGQQQQKQQQQLPASSLPTHQKVLHTSLSSSASSGAGESVASSICGWAGGRPGRQGLSRAAGGEISSLASRGQRRHQPGSRQRSAAAAAAASGSSQPASGHSARSARGAPPGRFGGGAGRWR